MRLYPIKCQTQHFIHPATSQDIARRTDKLPLLPWRAIKIMIMLIRLLWLGALVFSVTHVLAVVADEAHGHDEEHEVSNRTFVRPSLIIVASLPSLLAHSTSPLSHFSMSRVGHKWSSSLHLCLRRTSSATPSRPMDRFSSSALWVTPETLVEYIMEKALPILIDLACGPKRAQSTCIKKIRRGPGGTLHSSRRPFSMRRINLAMHWR